MNKSGSPKNKSHISDVVSDTEEIIADANTAAPVWSNSSLEFRSQALKLVADRLERARNDLVEVAARETHLSTQRLEGELTRTTFQLELFAEFVLDGSFLEATIDQADQDWPTGARPDLRRVLSGIGPVVVFAASNFPFAFSVAGGDTASALAAGCPVILKAHPGHPELSLTTADIVCKAIAEAGAPSGVFGIVYGEEAGRNVLLDPRVAAGAFTGSTSGGRFLFDLANSRPTPIPFYGEMGSLNPTFVTPGAIGQRRDEIIDGFIASFTLGSGQFCTKPGLLFVPAGLGIEDELQSKVASIPLMPLLNGAIATRYKANVAKVTSNSVVQEILNGSVTDGSSSPSLAKVNTRDFLDHKDELLLECFGPMALVVSYENVVDLIDIAASLDGQLTSTIHGVEGEELVASLASKLVNVSGRVIWNQWPTGVAVTWAMHHGGPYPATTSVLHTSVGTSAINRFLRPVSYQNFPAYMLPPPLQDDNPWHIPRRINGKLK